MCTFSAADADKIKTTTLHIYIYGTHLWNIHFKWANIHTNARRDAPTPLSEQGGITALDDVETRRHTQTDRETTNRGRTDRGLLHNQHRMGEWL